jgi:hypothetical protein
MVKSWIFILEQVPSPNNAFSRKNDHGVATFRYDHRRPYLGFSIPKTDGTWNSKSPAKNEVLCHRPSSNSIVKLRSSVSQRHMHDYDVDITTKLNHMHTMSGTSSYPNPPSVPGIVTCSQLDRSIQGGTSRA